jgi:hypothetical protein
MQSSLRPRRRTRVRSNGLHAPRLRSLAPDATKDLLCLSARYLPGWSDHPAASLPNVSAVILPVMSLQVCIIQGSSGFVNKHLQEDDLAFLLVSTWYLLHLAKGLALRPAPRDYPPKANRGVSWRITMFLGDKTSSCIV